MSHGLSEDLPESLRIVSTRALFIMRLDVSQVLDIGPTPGAARRVGFVSGGTFEGELLSGDVMSGNDWQEVRGDGTTALDVRLVLKTNDEALITMTYRGLRHGKADIIERIDAREPVDPATYYFRINPMFETASPKYDWINRLIGIGVGHRGPTGPIYSVFEVL